MTTGRRWIVRLQRYQNPRPACSADGWRNGSRSRSMLRPAKPSSAGSSVSAASMTASTVTTAEKATPGTYGWFIVSMPSSEMTTVMPANTTERPAVAIATATAPRRARRRRPARCGSG